MMTVCGEVSLLRSHCVEQTADVIRNRYDTHFRPIYDLVSMLRESGIDAMN